MTRTIIIAGGVVFTMTMTGAMVPGRAMAQQSQWCSGQASIVNGQIVTENVTPAGGVDSQCEVLITPGGMVVQNGGNTKANDGTDAKHEGAGGGHT